MTTEMEEKVKARLGRKLAKINTIFKTSNAEIEMMDNNFKQEEISMPALASTATLDLTDDQFMALELSEDGSIFELLELKSDFIMVKRNLKRLITHGQTIFDQTLTLDIADLKASQIEAIASLSNSINQNLMDLVGLYKIIVEIEQARRGNPGPTAYGQNNVVQGNLNQVFVGNAAEALQEINKAKIKVVNPDE